MNNQLVDLQRCVMLLQRVLDQVYVLRVAAQLLLLRLELLDFHLTDLHIQQVFHNVLLKYDFFLLELVQHFLAGGWRSGGAMNAG